MFGNEKIYLNVCGMNDRWQYSKKFEGAYPRLEISVMLLFVYYNISDICYKMFVVICGNKFSDKLWQ